MKLKVGDLAKLYGLSSQTLHYYEKQGILRPKRDIINSYRYYELSDFHILGTLKKFRNADFSLQDGVKICKKTNEHDLITLYQNHIDELWEEVQRKQVIIRQLEETLRLYTLYKSSVSSIQEQIYEPFLRFEAALTPIVFQNTQLREEAENWFKNIFFTYSSEMFYLNPGTGEYSDFTYGMLVTQKMANYLSIPITKNVQQLPSSRYLYMMICYEAGNMPPKAQHQILEYARIHNLYPCGNFISRVIMIFYEEKKLKVLKQLLIPVSENSLSSNI